MPSFAFYFLASSLCLLPPCAIDDISSFIFTLDIRYDVTPVALTLLDAYYAYCYIRHMMLSPCHFDDLRSLSCRHIDVMPYYAAAISMPLFFFFSPFISFRRRISRFFLSGCRYYAAKMYAMLRH